MKNILNVLWVDDEWFMNSDGDPSNEQFSEWENSWRDRLSRSSIKLVVTRRASPEILDKVLNFNYDALILDYGLGDVRGTYSNSVELLDVMRGIPRAAQVPAVILSKLAPGTLDHLSHSQLQGVFVKDATGVEAVGSFLESLARPQFLNLLLLSDLHVGFLPLQALGNGTLHHDRFFRSLTDRIYGISRENNIDAVVISGDFAWHSPAHEMERAAITVDQIARAAGVDVNTGLLFCPGNHDICYNHSDSGDWSAFKTFVERMAIGRGEQFYKRFVLSWNPVTRRLANFSSQNSLLSIVVNHAARFVFVGLNSCSPTGKKYECNGVVDGDQWDDIGAYLENVPNTYLRIGALHHPIFASPDGFWKPDFPIINQGSALRYFAKHGFSLIVHGHAHFSGVHSHQVHAMNRPGSINSGRTIDPTLVAVSCPSVLAEPDPNTPNRQFFLAKLRQQLRGGARKSWDFGLTSYVFEPSACVWERGDELPVGEITFGQSGKFRS